MANNGIYYSSGHSLSFTTSGITWATLTSGGTFLINTVSGGTYLNLPYSGTVVGGGTTNYVPVWTGSTGLGNSIIRANSTNVAINTSIASNTLLNLSTTATTGIFSDANDYGVYGVAQSSTGTGVFGANNSVTPGGVGVLGTNASGIGVYGQSVGDIGTNIGVRGDADWAGAGTPENIGGYFFAQNGGTNYSVQLSDGTEAVNKVLVSQTSDGKANWSDNLILSSVTLTEISATTYYNLPQSTSGAGTSNYVAKWTGSTGLGDSQIYDDGTFVGIGNSSQVYQEVLSVLGDGGIVNNSFNFVGHSSGSIAIADGNYRTWTSAGSEIAIGGGNPLSASQGNDNVAIGYGTLQTNSTGVYNVAIGKYALLNNQAGQENIAIGHDAGQNITSGSYNIAIGYGSLIQTDVGSDNIAIGDQAGEGNVDGNGNIYIGTKAGEINNGSNNVTIGATANQQGSGDTSVFIGSAAGFGATSNNSVFIGPSAGYNETSNQRLHIANTDTKTLIYGEFDNDLVKIGGTLSATTYQNLPGSSSSNCFTTFYVTNISGCSPVNILSPLNVQDGLVVNGGFTASTYYGLTNYNAGLLTNSNQWINNNDGTVTLPSAYVALYSQTGYSGTIESYLITSGTSGTEFPALSNNDTNYIVVDYSGGTPSWNILTDNSTINGTTIVLTHIIYRANNFLHVLDFGNEGVALPNKLNDRVIAIDRFGRESGFSLGLSASTGVVTLTSGVAWNGTNRQSLVAVNSQDDIFFQVYHTGGTWTYTTSANTLNNLYYDDGTNPVLATAGKYLVNWYFRGQEINDHLYEVWGSDEYDNVSEAQLSTEPNLPELITSHAFLAGRIIVQVSSTTGTVESAFVQVFQPSTVQAHNDLTSIQGGQAGEYYHLTSTEYSNLSSFKNIQVDGVTQFSSTSLTDNLNFSGINITITSAATNTLVFSAGTGGGGAVSSVTAGSGLSGNSTTGAITLINTQVQGITGITASSGISASTTDNVVTLTNTGVTGITAGSNISINQSTGNVTISSTGGGAGLGTVYTTANNFNFL